MRVASMQLMDQEIQMEIAPDHRLRTSRERRQGESGPQITSDHGE